MDPVGGSHRGLPCRPLPEAGLQDATEKDVIHLIRRHARPGNGPAHRDRTQISCCHRREGTHKGANGRPDRACDNWGGHGVRR